MSIEKEVSKMKKWDAENIRIKIYEIFSIVNTYSLKSMMDTRLHLSRFEKEVNKGISLKNKELEEK